MILENYNVVNQLVDLEMEELQMVFRSPYLCWLESLFIWMVFFVLSEELSHRSITSWDYYDNLVR